MDESNNETLFVRTNKSFIENSIDDRHGNQFKQQFINNKIDLEITDIHNEDKNDDDDDAEVLDDIQCRSINQNNFIDCMEFETIPIDHDTAVVNLKRILFGNAALSIGQEWLHQYFEFDAINSQLWYGLVQHKGGPCGVLASIQAFLCAEFFHWNRVENIQNVKDLHRYRNECLSKAIGNILWQIKRKDQSVIIAIESQQKILDETKDFRFDNITERLRIGRFESKKKLIDFLCQIFKHSNKNIGCVSFVYSCILTRGIEEIQHDYDPGSIQALLTPETLLCSQELVNLCLIGCAVSNVFDNNLKCDELVLQGVKKQSKIGFLTLYEYGGGAKVGSCYKSPKLPIFVILSEDHFTVLFAKDKINDDNHHQIELYYYDGLMNQENEIHLTIDTQSCAIHDDKHRSPLECVIQTKWPDCHINWNDSNRLF
ncbi:putative ubiquitin carboxyl-terminal hydrolase MINDY-4 isoform X1 [Dermatophagoides farinae]|uniref:putative ubiquitin carboxyl-terminal hydrolase MINDY-4 isoform X1 n=1 Tax=Dermatophagoides farinae TaxID=6954 RepID=UPI003F61C95F